jgi:hypothetical protein
MKKVKRPKNLKSGPPYRKSKKTYIRISASNDGKNWCLLKDLDPAHPFFFDMDIETAFFKRLSVTTVKLHRQ